MTRRSLLLALAGLVTVGFSSASAQPTKSELREKGKEAIERGQQKQMMKEAEEKYQNLTPEQKQQMQQKAKQAEELERKRWQALTPAQQQAEREKAMAAGKRLQYKWQQLPQ